MRDMTGKEIQAGRLMKNIHGSMGAVLGIVFLGLLAGCADMLRPPIQGDGGTGRALVRFGPRTEGARTLMPGSTEYEDLSYTLIFILAGGSAITYAPVTDGEALVELKPGIWDLSVRGYAGGTEILEGSESGIEVRKGETTPVTVMMKGKTEGGNGTLSYSVTFPDTASKGWLRIYGWDDGTAEETVNLLEGPSPGSGTQTTSGTLSLPAGYYRLGIDLYTDSGALNQSDIAHIYPALSTAMESVFEAGDFAAADILHTTSLAGVLSGIGGLADGADKIYVLAAGDETMAGLSVSHTGSLTLTIDGAGRAVTLSGAALITVGSGVTLKLKNMTLRGRVRVDTGGTLELDRASALKILRY